MWHVTASHVATFSVCSCREKCKSFLKDLNRAELLLLKFVHWLSKALCFDMIILNLFCTIVANLKCIRTAFSPTQHSSLVRESGPRLTVVLLRMWRLMLVNLFDCKSVPNSQYLWSWRELSYWLPCSAQRKQVRGETWSILESHWDALYIQLLMWDFSRPRRPLHLNGELLRSRRQLRLVNWVVLGEAVLRVCSRSPVMSGFSLTSARSQYRKTQSPDVSWQTLNRTSESVRPVNVPRHRQCFQDGGKLINWNSISVWVSANPRSEKTQEP